LCGSAFCSGFVGPYMQVSLRIMVYSQEEKGLFLRAGASPLQQPGNNCPDNGCNGCSVPYNSAVQGGYVRGGYLPGHTGRHIQGIPTWAYTPGYTHLGIYTTWAIHHPGYIPTWAIHHLGYIPPWAIPHPEVYLPGLYHTLRYTTH